MAIRERNDLLESRPAGPADEWPCHALSVNDAMTAEESGPSGLTEVEARSRLVHYGPNRLPPPKRRGSLQRFFAQFHDVLIYVLLGATVVTALLGHWIDAQIILAVVLKRHHRFSAGRQGGECA